MSVKKNHLFLILAFLAAISLPLAFSDKAGGKVSEMEKRTLAAFPRFLTEDKKPDPMIRTNLEMWIDDNVGFRAPARSLQAAIDFDVFHISPSRDVIAGEDGWYFYSGEDNLHFALDANPVSPTDLEKIKNVQEAIQASLKNRGIDYVIVLVPSKESVYPENIGGGFSVRRSTIDIVADYLQKNTTIPVINLKPALLAAKKEQQIYFKMDTHWNSVGAYTGYQTMIERLNELGIIHSLPFAFTTERATQAGDLTIMMGGKDFLPPEAYDSVEKTAGAAVRVKSGEAFDRLNAIVAKRGLEDFIAYQNDKAENVNLLIVGDSFFDGLRMPWMMAENFSYVNYVRSRILWNDVVEEARPDVVILEIAERYITFVTSNYDNALTAGE